jgi:CRISPR-associated endonuclease/helicase Cas3
MDDTIWFGEAFEALTGQRPFPWQEALFLSFRLGMLPRRCDIPTGLGKTSVIHIWLLALSRSLSEGNGSAALPRRLVYIVDRRVVVDQATDEAERMLSKLEAAAVHRALRTVKETLAECQCTPNAGLLTLSTLRGQHADNHLWHFDPSRPSVIIGTVDMIGSRLLFSGYGGLGRYRRSLHAGLLAQDALLAFDEAHLTPAFAETLEALEQQMKRTTHIRPFHLMFLSATLPPSALAAGQQAFRLTPADLQDGRVIARVNAKKTLRFLPPSEDADYAERIGKAAVGLAQGGKSVVVMVSTVKMVNQVANYLRAQLPPEHRNRVLPVTGEMRGKERDELMSDPVLAAFAPNRERRLPGAEPAFLIATSCVEVGFNFDADHAV